MKFKVYSGIFLALLVSWCCQCSSGGSSSSSASDKTGLDLIKSYGIDTDLGDAKDADGNDRSETYNPLGNKLTRVMGRSEIFVAGAYWKESGAFYDKRNLIIDESATNAYAPLSCDSDASWTLYPNASIGADLDGLGVQKIVTAVFVPDSGSINLGSSTAGSIQLQIISGTTTFSRTTKILKAGATFTANNNSPTPYYLMDIASGDIDGDGKSELAVAAGQTLLICDDDFSIIKEKDFSNSSYDTIKVHSIEIDSGDIDGDGLDDFVVADSIEDQNLSNYYIFGGASAAQKATGSISLSSRGMIKNANVALGDIDGDRQLEVVFAGVNATGDKNTIDVYAAKWDSSSSNLAFMNCYYTRSVTWSDHLVPALVCYNPNSKDSSTAADRMDSIFIVDAFAKYDTSATTKMSATLGSTQEAGRKCAIVGDFNADGKKEIAVLRRSSPDLHIYGVNSAGTFTQLASYNFDYGQYTSLCAADVRGNSLTVEFSKHELKFSSPVVVAAIASPPYFADAVDAGSLTNYGTSFGTSTSSGTSASDSFSVSASYSVGVSVETPLWGSAASFESKATFGASFTKTAETVKETTVSHTYTCAGGEDLVIFTAIPVDVYTYNVVTSPNLTVDSEKPPTVTVNVPRTPQMIAMERDKYNALQDIPVKIENDVLIHTIGDPWSYASKTTIGGYMNDTTSAGGGLWDSIGMSVGDSSGSLTDTVEQSSTTTSTYGVGFSVSLETTMVTSGALFGSSYGFEGDLTYGFSTGNGTTIEGVVPNAKGSSSGFKFGIAAYQQTIDAQTDTPFLVVTYWVGQ